MPISTTISTPGALEAEFRTYGRGNQFSWAGFKALFEYLEDVSEDMGEDLNIDVIGLCCEWSEYDDLADLIEEFSSRSELPSGPSPHSLRYQFQKHMDLKAVRDYVERHCDKWQEQLLADSDEKLEEIRDNTILLETEAGGYLVAY
tara:strand:+ start:506 stop:943 length:438 start_codon:yes stop_codon:yes gene_type:complete